MSSTHLAAPVVLLAAIESARDRTIDLIAGVSALAAMAGNDKQPEIEGDALRWMAERLRIAADDILTELDHAERAREGAVYIDGETRFRAKIDALGDLAQRPN
ncbi:hypothetical protein AiwAL_16905 [Acidiphilium sp. AL]|uniref:hypothetical protein n=1 Tax=Acidiphilium sp. AL TaxID=2871704 RepID=UPI0021CAFBD2|nr:hypothetical protein [Acidiphilium sp. AL]MCU4161760.1 hypothetical protein [Acidiphilium sp. AL]